MKCLRGNGHSHIACKHLSKAYLECRMDQGLMQHENLESLGFRPEDMALSSPDESGGAKGGSSLNTKEQEGFIAGLGVKKKREGVA